MAKPIIATPEFSDAGTLAGLGTLAGTMPVTNLQTLQPGEPARWTSLSGMGLELDLGGAVAVNIVALLAHNATAAATWRIRAAGAQGDLTGNPGYDTGSVSLWPSGGKPSPAPDRLGSIHAPAAAQSFRWWRIDLADAANPDGFFEAGRLMVDAALQTARAQDLGGSIGRADDSDHVIARGGHIRPNVRPNRAVQRVRFSNLTKAEALGRFNGIERTRGRGRDILVVPNADESDWLHVEMIHGLMTRLGGVRQTSALRWSAALEVEELVP